METQRINHRRRRRNLPAELKVEIVDCLPLENAAHFLANVPTRLIIHHCAPRVRRMLKMIHQIVADYARTLPTPNSSGDIWVRNGYHYTPEMNIFLRYGAAYCEGFVTWPGTANYFVLSPPNFFDDLIKYYYETKAPRKAVHYVIINFPLANPAPWPTALVQPQAREMKVEELKVDNVVKRVLYILRNKHNPGVAFKLGIYFGGNAQCHQQMSNFSIWRVDYVQSHEAWK